jgi:hypothetical protein
MITDILNHPPSNPIPEGAREAVQHATDAAKEAYNTVSTKVEDTMIRTKEYVRQNPLPIVLGALAVGAVLGCLVVMARRQQPTLRERFMDDPVHTSRDILYAALAPVGQRLHDGYDTARDGAGRALDKLQHQLPSRHGDSWSDQLGRVGSNLKFW